MVWSLHFVQSLEPVVCGVTCDVCDISTDVALIPVSFVSG